MAAIFWLHAGSVLHRKSVKIAAHESTSSFKVVLICLLRGLPPKLWRYLETMLNGKCKQLVAEVSFEEVNERTTRKTRDTKLQTC